ncbi:MAG TPA: hypothetical protein VFK14_11990 [Solirubrobacterales bacterium]|nr:hypothetical protein [Solirubrobacterales bacterium]
MGVAIVLFTALSFIVYGWYAFHGGFVADDWVNADHYYFHPGSGFWAAYDNYQTPSRPVSGIWVTLTYAVMGVHFVPHLILAVCLTAFFSIAFYAFLRTLGLTWYWALPAAALLLVFPSSDSTRFWVTGSQINLFMGMYLVAAVIAIRARRRWGPAPTLGAVLAQAAASAIAVAAVAGYEIVAIAVLLSFLLYRWAGGRGGVVWRWLMDAIPTLLVLYFLTRNYNGGAAHGSQLLTNVRLIADGAIHVVGYSFVPLRTFSPWPVFALVVGVIALAAAMRWLVAATPRREAVSRWWAPLLLAVAGIGVGYAMIYPAADRYPLYAAGVQNRTNCFAALSICLLIVFVFATIAAILTAAIPKISDRTRTQLRGGVTVVLIGGLFVSYTVRIVQDERRWTRAAEVQATILEGTHRLVPSPPPDATIFTSPYAGYSSPSLPIFGGGGNNDELGAFKVSYDSEEMRAFPLLGEEEICGPKVVSTPDAANSETEYGKAILVDLRASTVYRPRNQAQCLRDAKAMEPFGPVNLRDDW